LKNLIVTADDFGAAREVNDAVERAHREGILSAASLMVAAPAATDAVARARTMPRLGVGLHVVLAEGRSVLPPAEIPALVDADGFFRNDMVWPSVKMAFLPAVRRQVGAEIEAQFKAFAESGLKLDHVDAHKHFHLHPTVAGLILEIGRRYGMTAMRLPYEPLDTLRQVEPHAGGGGVPRVWAKRLRRRVTAEGMWSPDRTFGLCWSGAMIASRLGGLIANLPEGVTEIYLHPATGSYVGSTPGYRYAEELAALQSKEVIDIATKKEVRLGVFADFVPRTDNGKMGAQGAVSA
jgi:hopanoid biosynthesis associated protein HpnK